MRRVGWWLLVGVGLVAAYYALTFVLVVGWFWLGDRLPLAIGLSALILIPAAGAAGALIDRLDAKE